MPFRTSIRTGPTPLTLGSESPVWTKTSQMPSAQALRFRPSAAVNGAPVVVVGADVVGGDVVGGDVVDDVRGAAEVGAAAVGGSERALHPTTSRSAGNAMSIRRTTGMIMYRR